MDESTDEIIDVIAVPLLDPPVPTLADSVPTEVLKSAAVLTDRRLEMEIDEETGLPRLRMVDGTTGGR